ncbi:ABC transporter ATP-binding protein [Kocuria massiliensis]|uniref:ABC transporter ATP-binding protein n=1 Tax=Kocuria massiliensis TaxID=1926282 RepID=UPI000A1C9C99|nr:ABC transporter ATP-binding protein [Kocuria massiliensis]
MNEPVIEAHGLTKTFTSGSGASFNAVDGIDLTIGRGEIIGLLGPNGAGKSTLIDMVLGLTKPDQGTITVLGGAPRSAIARGDVGAVLQTGGLLPQLSVRDTLRMIAATHHHEISVDDILAQADLTELADRKVVKCSGGEQQRIRFALAIMPSPELLILDEPTSGMDANARHKFWESMRQQAHHGRTIVFATHYIEEAQNFAERIVMVGKGRIVADGPTDDVRSRVSSQTVSAILPDGFDARTLPGVLSATVTGNRTTMTTADADVLARHLLTHTTAENLLIANASLEDAFITLTSENDAASPAT